MIISKVLTVLSYMLRETCLSVHAEGLWFFKKFIFLYLAAPDLSCSMWDLVPWAGFEPGSTALGVWSLSHWTTWEVPEGLYFKFCKSGETDGQRGMFSKLQLSRSNSTGHGTIDWFKIGKSITRSYIVTLFNFYTEYIMQNARLDESQARIKIARRNINNLNMQMIPF